jgi:hypothetical protein
MEKINLLHLLADAFPTEPIPDVHPATLEEFCKELEDVLKGLGDTNIEPELRAFIQTSLDTLLMVVRSYDTFGPDGAARIFGSVAAELARKTVQEPPSTKEGKSALQKAVAIAKKFGEVVIWTSAVVGGADGLITHADHITTMITGPEQSVKGPSES